jgi:hypothetical protein
MMAAVSVLALRHGSLLRWLAILGFPLAALTWLAGAPDHDSNAGPAA